MSRFDYRSPSNGLYFILMVALGWSVSTVWTEIQRSEFCLKKEDWKCTQKVTRTTLTLQTSTNANGTVTTTTVPVTETHCVKYEPSTN